MLTRLRFLARVLLLVLFFATVFVWLLHPVRVLPQLTSRQQVGMPPALSKDVGPLAPSEVYSVVLWTSHRRGEVGIFRIPVLTYTPRGNLVAMVEGRRNSEKDDVPKVIAVKRSTNAGQTWSPSQWIVDDGNTTRRYCSNVGTIFVDDMTATIFLMYMYCGFCPTRSLMLVNSTDDGITWGRPRNITNLVGKNYVAHPSPGYGIQKKHDPAKGRLIVCGHGFHDGLGIVLLLSDDHGVTWRHGAFVPSVPFRRSRKGDFDPDECQPIELPDGSIRVVVRNEHVYKCNCKMIMKSFDGGETLPKKFMFLDTSLIEPKITSGVWYHNGVLFYSGPNNSNNRTDLQLRWSYNNGRTWSKAMRLWGHKASYSTLTMLPNDQEHLYILYERGIKDFFEEIAIEKMKISMIYR
ncbi:NEU1 [Branchiostoma lanceolatum]|uniref:Sialidase-1 n=2 Tax=Branchiostoma lanceolatum TaxID=7740 RepID=A0A8K0EZS0_BRALA|nr:NEU1 [Branchiostoma lanceolatum]